MEALPHAIVFDMDGTLTDSEEEWDVVRRGLAAADGVPWPEGATQAMMGMSTREWSTYLVEAVDLRGTPEEAAQRTIDGMAAAYRAGRIPSPFCTGPWTPCAAWPPSPRWPWRPVPRAR